MAEARYNYNVVLRPEPEGGCIATVPAFPGCVTYGRDLDEARKMAECAIDCYVESLRGHEEAASGITFSQL